MILKKRVFAFKVLYNEYYKLNGSSMGFLSNEGEEDRVKSLFVKVPK